MWNVAETSGGTSTRRHAEYVIAAMVLELFAELLAVNVVGRGSSHEQPGMIKTRYTHEEYIQSRR